MINSPKTFSKLKTNAFDDGIISFAINSEAIVSSKTDKQTFVNELMQSQYYTYSTIPLSQFIQDGTDSNYFSTSTILKNTLTSVLYSKFSSKNTITNKNINSFDIDIQSQTYWSAGNFWRYSVNSTSDIAILIGNNGNISNLFVEYLVTYPQITFINQILMHLIINM